MFEHADVLAKLNEGGTLAERLEAIHHAAVREVGHVARIAVALYEPASDVVKTFIHSSDGAAPLSLYSTRLAAATGLREVAERRKPRFVPDLGIYEGSEHEHTRRILAQGYAASYTVPIFTRDALIGFVFFNSYTLDPWDEKALERLDVFAHLVSLLVANELAAIRTLLAAVRTSREFAKERDPETGAHLERMARYSQLIATELAAERKLDDDYVEHIFLFSPLHDLGKVAIPDSILLKPGRLTAEEFEVMKTHAEKGRRMIESMLSSFGLEGFEHLDMLRNIAHHHHEAVDGTGYPDRLAGEKIPLEARIVAVADVFDALTSHRSYKRAWTNEEAFATLRRLSGHALDPECVEAFERRRPEIEKIQRAFREDLAA